MLLSDRLDIGVSDLTVQTVQTAIQFFADLVKLIAEERRQQVRHRLRKYVSR